MMHSIGKLSSPEVPRLYGRAVYAITSWIDSIDSKDIAPLEECTLLIPEDRPDLVIIVPIKNAGDVIVTFTWLAYGWERNLIIHNGEINTQSMMPNLRWIEDLRKLSGR